MVKIDIWWAIRDVERSFVDWRTVSAAYPRGMLRRDNERDKREEAYQRKAGIGAWQIMAAASRGVKWQQQSRSAAMAMSWRNAPWTACRWHGISRRNGISENISSKRQICAKLKKTMKKYHQHHRK